MARHQVALDLCQCAARRTDPDQGGGHPVGSGDDTDTPPQGEEAQTDCITERGRRVVAPVSEGVAPCGVLPASG